MPVTRPPAARSSSVTAPHTLTLDIVGTGLKATVLDPHGQPEHDRGRVATTYNNTPLSATPHFAG